MRQKIILLDIDGVLNSAESLRRRVQLDPLLVRRLNQITDTTAARIVVSSTWRKEGLRKVTKRLSDGGVRGRVIGVTPDLSHTQNGVYVSVERGKEVQAWLDDNARNVFSFAVLDDDNDLAPHMARLVQCNPAVGLSDANVRAALALLNKEW